MKSIPSWHWTSQVGSITRAAEASSLLNQPPPAVPSAIWFWPSGGSGQNYAPSTPSHWRFVTTWANALFASFLTLEYSISMHLHSTFHEICTIHECIHIVRTPKCREISQKVMAQPGFEPGTFLFRGCSNHWAIRPSLQLCDNFTCKFVKIWAQICDKIFRMNKIYSFKAYFELNLDPGPKFKLKTFFF